VPLGNTSGFFSSKKYGNKMRTLLIESCEKKITDASTSSIVHVRNSQVISKALDFDFVSHQSEIDAALENKYDTIICAYGSQYMKYDNYLRILDNNLDAKLFWLVNDHDVEDNILLRKWLIKYNRPYHMICNNPREGYRGWILRKKMNGKTLNDWIDEWYTLNLNTLIFDEELFYKTLNTKKSDVIYYGTFRKHRIKDMLDYNTASYFLSTSKKNHVKYQAAGIDARYIDPIMWTDKESDLFDHTGCRLQDFKYSIYFEDEHTHKNYAFMANRFYEAVMSNSLMLFDSRCSLVIEKCGYAIDPFQIVKDGDDLNEKVDQLNSDDDSYKHFLSIQQSNVPLIVKEKQDVLQRINQIAKLGN